MRVYHIILSWCSVFIQLYNIVILQPLLPGGYDVCHYRYHIVVCLTRRRDKTAVRRMHVFQKYITTFFWKNFVFSTV